MTSSNNERILAIDFGRGMSVLVMILVHTLWVYGDTYTQSSSVLGHVVHFLGKGTPMFLVAMGVSFIISKRQSLTGAAKRGVFILLAGYLLNFLKFIVPIALFKSMPEGFVQEYGWSTPLSSGQLLWLVGLGDILQLAGVALFVMAVVNHFVKQKYILLLISLLFIVPARELQGTSLDLHVIHYLCELFFSAGWHVYFPVFPWISFIFAGMFFGRWYLERDKDQNFLFNKMLLFGVVFLPVGGLLCYWNFDYHFGDFFHLGPGGAVYLMGLNFVCLWVVHQCIKLGKANAFTRLTYYASKHVTILYIIQWTLVFWLTAVFGYKSHDPLATGLIMPVLVLSTFGVHYLIRLMTKGSALPSLSSN